MTNRESDTTQEDLFDGIVTAVEGATDMHLSNQILDPSYAPNTKGSKAFSIEVQTANSELLRDHRNRRIYIENAVLVRVAHRMNPKKQYLTQRTAYQDEQKVIIALMTVDETNDPLCYTTVNFKGVARTINEEREWLFTDVSFTVEFEFGLEP